MPEAAPTKDHQRTRGEAHTAHTVPLHQNPEGLHMTAVIELAAHVSRAVDNAEKQFYGPSAYLTDLYDRRRRIQQKTRNGMDAATIAASEGVTPRNVVRHRSMPEPSGRRTS